MIYGQSPYSTNIMDFRGFDPSKISIVKGGIPRPIVNSPESLNQAILARIILVVRLGVQRIVYHLSTDTHHLPSMFYTTIL